MMTSEREGTMATETKRTKPQLKSPGRMDFKKADKALKKAVKENKAWFKEMANR